MVYQKRLSEIGVSTDNLYMPKAILKSNEEVALLLMMRPARTDAGKRVQQTVLFRIETLMAIADLSK